MSILTGKRGVEAPVEVLMLSKAEVEGLITYKEALEVEEEAYRALGLGQVIQPHKSLIFTDPPDNNNRMIAMPVFIKNMGVAGIKWGGNYFKQEPGIPGAWGGVIILNRAGNGQPFSIMDATAVTTIRTACHSAIAAKYLAKKNSRNIAMIGCGNEAYTALAAYKELFPLEGVKVYDIKPEAMTAYKQEVEARFAVKVIPTASAKEACESCDIICVVTNSWKPVVLEPWVPAGCFVSGIMEFVDLDPELSKKADKWVAGDLKADEHHGKNYHPGLIDYGNAYAEVGELVTGAKPGRENDQERTVYTHFGMAAHDIPLANFVYNKAVKQGLGKKFRLV